MLWSLLCIAIQFQGTNWLNKNEEFGDLDLWRGLQFYVANVVSGQVRTVLEWDWEIVDLEPVCCSCFLELKMDL